MPLTACHLQPSLPLQGPDPQAVVNATDAANSTAAVRSPAVKGQSAITTRVRTVFVRRGAPTKVRILGAGGAARGGAPPLRIDYVTPVSGPYLDPVYGPQIFPFSATKSADGRSVELQLGAGFVWPGFWYAFIRWPVGYTVVDSLGRSRTGTILVRVSAI